jgi:Fe-S-cluster containining protein
MEKGQCNQCGVCCNPITTQWLKKDITDDSYTHKFIRKHWKRISKKKVAAKLNKIDRRDKKGNYYYECSKFDKKANKCTAYNERPNVCKNYPFYGKDTLPDDFIYDSGDCGFNLNNSPN